MNGDALSRMLASAIGSVIGVLAGIRGRRHGSWAGGDPARVHALVCPPQTAVLGAIMLTGYLGGAVAVKLRVGDPLFTHVLFGVYVGVLVWGGIYLRDARLRQILPLRLDVRDRAVVCTENSIPY
jgi:hypothetical protein